MKQFILKRIALLIVLTVTFMLSSCRSIEDNVHELTTEYIKSTLFDKKSYEEMYFQMDSVFSLDGSTNIYIDYLELKEKIDEVKKMTMNSSNYYYNNRFGNDSKRAEKENRKIEKKKNRIASSLNNYVELLNSMDTAKFAGYFVEVAYTAKNLKGGKVPGRLIAIVDKTGESIIYTYSFSIEELLDLSMGKGTMWQRINDYLYEIESDSEAIDIDDFLESVTMSTSF